MTHDQPHHEHAQDAFIDALFEHSPINIAALLRACADGELNPDQCERLAEVLREHPQGQPQREFEQMLRASCSRSMSNQPPCPQSLRDRVSAIAVDSSAAAESDSDAFAQRLEQTGAYTRESSFWSRAPLMTAAAVLLIGVAGVMIWQSSSLFSNQPSSNGPGEVVPVSYIDHLGNFMMGEHKRYCIDEAATERFAQTDIDSAIGYFSERFERDVQIPDLASNEQTIEFFGGGDCSIPRTAMSGHLRFDTADENGEQVTFSLFVAPDSGQLELEAGVTYLVNAKACDEAGARLFVWVHEGVQYFLISEAKASTCGAVRGLMKAPETMGKI